ncbi:hypothetical protein [Paenibacillus spongiae]|uniref:Heparin-sulfate lyase N-terminal domain-containing protein n=1 Tax=Paenibacillus spongiae TaxID=2909671 RepID=A0ABY5SDZ7_9BACL|nr:hypothetical protein [Paenibacillus spongiae]UVI31999.1 hypothetical protein L1F29_09365 [Paenibacillus spongiae]
MNKQTAQIWQMLWEKFGSQLIVEEGLVNLGRPGHTIEASKVQEAHEGRSTASYYVVAMALGVLDEEEGLRILEALSELQITDESSKYFGAFRWYREENRINDSNAAFFILMPLVVMRLCLNELIPATHRKLLDQMLIRGAVWFEHELKEPILYYSNKIVSDGALLLGISRICGLEKCRQAGTEFFERWLAYTSRRGWGWGENISLIYIGVIMNALQIANISLEGDRCKLWERLHSVMDEVTDYVRFHGGYEFVPSIRSYNFHGELHPVSLLWRIAGIESKQSSEELPLGNLESCITYLLFEDNLQKEESICELPIPRTRIERIMDSCHAHTWVGATGRIGSVNRFPAINGSYQFPSWGLGWQSYPVSLAVNGHQVSFLCWHVHEGEHVRTHPAAYKDAYLRPALFREDWFPDIQLRSVQRDNAVLVVRSMSRLHNEASEIADEWIVNRWAGEQQTALGADGREWTILQYPRSAVLIAPLIGIGFGENVRRVPALQSVMNGDMLRLRQVLYAGETKLLQQPRLESGWAIYYADGVDSLSQATELAARLRLEETSYKDGEVPRTEYTEIRSVSLLDGDMKLAELVVDPHLD